MSRIVTHLISTLLFCIVLIYSNALAGSNEGYQLPPKPVADLIDAPWTPSVSISPDKKWMLLTQYPGYPSIEEVAQKELRIAGLRINPKTNGPSRAWRAVGLKLKKISDGSEYEISGLPENALITNSSWSNDGNYISFINTTETGLNLWLISVKDRTAKKLSDVFLNGASGTPYRWSSDNKTIYARSIISSRGEAPVKPGVPVGPIIQVNLGRKAPARTYQDLLTNKYDESLFEYYMLSQVIKITLDGTTTKLGTPGLFTYAGPSPDGKYLLVEQTHRPFSYTITYRRFPEKSQIWDTDGKLIYEVFDAPLSEEIPISYGSVRTGRRSINWRNDAPAQIVWTEALDGGDAGAEAEYRDEIFMLDTPFDKEPVSLIKLPLRSGGITWGNDKLAIASCWYWKTRQTQSWIVQPGNPSAKPELLIDRSWEDRYGDPGNPLTKMNKWGKSVLLTDKKGKFLYLSAQGASDEGDRPFIDEFDIKTKKATRLFRSEAPYFESLVKFIDVDKKILLTRRESVTEQPNYFIRDLNNNKLTQVTDFPHPTPQLKDVQKEMIHFKRSDGVDLTGTLYLPPGYTKDQGPLPMLMWAYPQEFKDASAASQVTGSPHKFVRVSGHSPLLWLMMGYAVLDDPSMPIVGEGDDEPNDKFIEQLVSSAQAAIDEVVKLGVADREKIAIGGHSYGAFMTANLLAHSDLFRLGVARSGAYNRTLTPFGFQSEERTLWEAPEVYFTMSPFMHAEKIDEPILLIHGQADNNSGTYPLQSERFYSALKGHGATAKLVMLPHESHGYRARESLMHMLYETNNWLDKYVKNAEPREVLKTETETGGK